MIIGIAGMKVTANSAATMATKIFTMYGVTPSIFVCAIPQPTNRHEPTGGVTEPMPRFMISIKPKCTGFMPTEVAIGRKIGVKIRTAGVRSRNMPMMRRNTFMIRRMT